MNREELRRKFSSILINNSEENPLECDIYLDMKDSYGLSSLDMPEIISLFQEPSEGIIWINIKGYPMPIEFDDFLEDDLEYILKQLLNGKSN